jgi:formylmethanofuran dehydrogenase subunit C
MAYCRGSVYCDGDIGDWIGIDVLAGHYSLYSVSDLNKHYAITKGRI